MTNKTKKTDNQAKEKTNKYYKTWRSSERISIARGCSDTWYFREKRLKIKQYQTVNQRPFFFVTGEANELLIGVSLEYGPPIDLNIKDNLIAFYAFL
uniref:Uncharacterized protein n=1 Tax=Strongyloides venezuelensis TaxID=75913 RepID=A0A0K0FSP7_STRVS